MDRMAFIVHFGVWPSVSASSRLRLPLVIGVLAEGVGLDLLGVPFTGCVRDLDGVDDSPRRGVPFACFLGVPDDSADSKYA